MKNLKNLGKVLSTKEQKNVNGGRPLQICQMYGRCNHLDNECCNKCEGDFFDGYGLCS